MPGSLSNEDEGRDDMDLDDDDDDMPGERAGHVVVLHVYFTRGMRGKGARAEERRRRRRRGGVGDQHSHAP